MMGRISILRPGLESPGPAGSKDSSLEHFRQTVQEEMSANIGCELRRKKQREREEGPERERDKPEEGPGRERTKTKTNNQP